MSFVSTLSLHFSTGLSSSLWDLSSWADQQCQPPSSQPVSHHLNSRHFGHHLLDCGRSCVHLPAGLAQPGLQHCGWSHFHLHTGYQLHAVCASGKKKTAQDMHANVPKSSGENAVFLLSLWKNSSDISLFFRQNCHLIIGYYVWKPAFITDSEAGRNCR